MFCSKVYFANLNFFDRVEVYVRASTMCLVHNVDLHSMSTCTWYTGGIILNQNMFMTISGSHREAQEEN